MRHFVCSFILFIASTLLAAATGGVGASLTTVLEDDFATFFNLTQQQSQPLDFGQKELHYKTGGFQEHIDLYLIVDKNNTLLTARIEVDYQFISTQKTFAIDVIKSFLKDFCHQTDAAVCNTLAIRLMEGEGEVAPELAGVMKVLNSKKKWDSSTLQESVLTTETLKQKIRFAYHWINWTETVVRPGDFLIAEELQAYQLELTTERPTVHYWTNLSSDKVAFPFSRLVEARWVFKSLEEAANYYRAYQVKQAEGMQLLPNFEAAIGEEVQVYQAGAAQQETMARIGMASAPPAYLFYIRKRNCVTKLFVLCKVADTLEKATAIATLAAKKM